MEQQILVEVVKEHKMLRYFDILIACQSLLLRFENLEVNYFQLFSWEDFIVELWIEPKLDQVWMLFVCNVLILIKHQTSWVEV